MTPVELFYKEYKAIRNNPNTRYMSARQAFLWVRSRVVQRCRNQLLSDDDPRLPENVCTAKDCATTHHFQYNGYDCTLDIEPDPDILDDDIRGYAVRSAWVEIEFEGWGREGMDIGEYKTSDTIVGFNGSRQSILPYAPKGMSKQVAYEWATEIMQSHLEDYRARMNDELRNFVVALECKDLGIQEALWGIEVDVTDAESERYLEDVVDELYDQLVCEFDRLKKTA